MTIDCETLDELENLLPNSNNVTHMFNIKAWLDGQLVNMQTHTQLLQLKIMKNEENIRTWYKGTPPILLTALPWFWGLIRTGDFIFE